MLRTLRTKRDSLMGHVEVELTIGIEQRDQSFNTLVRVIASKHGVQIAGMVSGHDELEALAQAVSEAWNEYINLKPKLITTLSGH